MSLSAMKQASQEAVDKLSDRHAMSAVRAYRSHEPFLNLFLISAEGKGNPMFPMNLLEVQLITPGAPVMPAAGISRAEDLSVWSASRVAIEPFKPCYRKNCRQRYLSQEAECQEDAGGRK